MHNANEIRSTPCPECKICGSPGIPTYKDLPDRLFSSPGLWNLSKCSNSECGLMWLDPMPLEEDIYKAYRSYYTHGDKSGGTPSLEARITKALVPIFQLFMRLTPIHRERVDIEQMFLGNIVPGRVLEVGCGDGTMLSRLADLGWSVEGQEVDPISATIAAKANITIHLGSLVSLNLPEASYDAIVMNHVIEHVHDPVKLLAECQRLLKPGGILVAVTPNIRSFAHRAFHSNWRDLDPPRHVMIHCRNSLHPVAEKAGFASIKIRTVSAKASSIYRSLQLKYENKYPKVPMIALCYAGTLLFMVLAWLAQRKDPDSGEECLMILKKLV